MHRLLGRGLAPPIVMTAVVLLSGCSLDSASGTGDIAATPATILARLPSVSCLQVTFQGPLPAVLILVL